MRNELAGEAPSLAVPLGSRSHTDKAVDVFNAVQEIVEPHALIPLSPRGQRRSPGLPNRARSAPAAGRTA
jgi:small ligand-binding sensory domain FIST